MELKNILYSKNGLSTMALAKIFLSIQIGEKIPTVTELNTILGQARGTIQNAIKSLQNSQTIQLEARGHLGTFLIQKDVNKLLAFAGITSIVGVMPLPYSKRYEGFASGIIVALENKYNIPISMAYMRGAKNRIAMLLSDRYDFAIISKYAALTMIEEGIQIDIVKNFGQNSYLSNHIIVFHGKDKKEIENGMKVGIDKDSVDQKKLTEQVCKGKKVEYVNIEYTQILKKIYNGELDAAVWNEDEITDKLVDINYVVIDTGRALDNEAVLVVNSNKTEMISLLEEIVDVDSVLEIQKLVLDNMITPSY